MCYTGRPTTIFSACDDNDGEILYRCDPRVGRIFLECMLNKSICKNKNYYLLLLNILYIIKKKIIIVFTLFN